MRSRAVALAVPFFLGNPGFGDPATLIVEGIPGTARIEIDGRPASVGPASPHVLPSGIHWIVRVEAGTVVRDTLLFAHPGDTLRVDLGGPAPAPSGAGAFAGSGFVRIDSDPPGAVIRVDAHADSIRVPSVAVLPAGEHLLRVAAPGHEPLEFLHRIEDRDAAWLRFVLLRNRPPGVVPEELGLEYRMEMPLRDETEAEFVQDRFTSLAEVFAIVPLSQGLLAKLAGGESVDSQANALIGIGVGLSAGSYLLGKILAGRRRGQVRSHNADAVAFNESARAHNTGVERQLRELDATRQETWRSANRDRGLVETVLQGTTRPR